MPRTGVLMYILDMPWIPESRVTLHWGDFFRCEPDWYWSVRALPDLDLWFVESGDGWIAGGGRRVRIRSGDCVLLRRGYGYEAEHEPSRPLRLIAIHFDLLSENEGQSAPPSQLPRFQRRMEYGSFFRELLARAVRAHKDGCREWADAWFQAAWMELVRQEATRSRPGLFGDQTESINRICERIRRHPERDFRVEELAAELAVSPEHFSRLFRRLQGMPPRAFITRTRIEAAQTLLLASSHSVARIAEILGYTSPFYFSRHFKAAVGLSPSAFRSGGRLAKRLAEFEGGLT